MITINMYSGHSALINRIYAQNQAQIASIHQWYADNRNREIAYYSDIINKLNEKNKNLENEIEILRRPPPPSPPPTAESLLEEVDKLEERYNQALLKYENLLIKDSFSFFDGRCKWQGSV